MTDLDLLSAVLEADDRLRASDSERPGLHPREREVFAGWRERAENAEDVGHGQGGWCLTERQRAWLGKAATRLGVLTELPAANTYSSWSPAKQAAERALVKTVLPFEGRPRALKPPGRA